MQIILTPKEVEKIIKEYIDSILTGTYKYTTDAKEITVEVKK